MPIEVGDKVVVRSVSSLFLLSGYDKLRWSARVGQIGLVTRVGSINYGITFFDGELFTMYPAEIVKTAAQELIDVHRGR